MGFKPLIRELQALLRLHGLRVTPQRLAIAEVLFAGSMHITAQVLYSKLKGRFPSLSANTVYLTLSQFEERGLLRRLYVDGNTIFDSNTQMHDHACCSHCGKIMDLPSAGRSDAPGELDGWRVVGQSRLWTGLCPDCIEAD